MAETFKKRLFTNFHISLLRKHGNQEHLQFFKATGIYSFSKDTLPEDVYHPGALHSANDIAISPSLMLAPQQFSGVCQRKSSAHRARAFDDMASTSVSPNSSDQIHSDHPAREVEETTVRRKH